MRKSALLKKAKKIRSKKTLNYFLLNHRKNNIYFCSRHNSMTELCHTLFKYENKVTWVEIINLKLSS